MDWNGIVLDDTNIKHVVVISDLHMGINGSKNNDFKLDDAKFSSYLKYRLNTNADLIIVNGDCFELWEFGMNMSDKKALKRLKNVKLPNTKKLFDDIVKSYPLTTDMIINHPKIILINGNHDTYLRTHTWVNKCVCDVKIPRLSLYIAHGHMSETLCSDDSLMSCISKTAASAFSVLELVNPRNDDNLEVLSHSFTRGKNKNYNALEHGLLTAKALNSRIVVYGHTHVPFIFSMDGMIYANSGRCRDRVNEFDEVDIDLSDKFNVVEVSLLNVHLDDEVKYQISGRTFIEL